MRFDRPLVSARQRALVRRRVLAAMTAQVLILRGDLGVLDPTSGKVGGLENAQTIYKGSARIRTVNGGVQSDGADGTRPVRRTILSIPMDAPVPHADDLVLVLNDDDADPDLDTRILRITDVEGGGLFGDARRVNTEGWHDSRYWGHQ